MKITSKFRDYYDFVAGKYGGGDPKIQYLRLKVEIKSCDYNEGGNLHRGEFAFPLAEYKKNDYKFKWLTVVGKSYLLVDNLSINNEYGEPILHIPHWHILNETLHPDVWEWIVNKKQERRGRYNFYSSKLKSISDYLGNRSSICDAAAKYIKQPVFIFNITHLNYHSGKMLVEENIPNLGKLGMGGLVAPEILYQEISYYLGNIINKTPDLEPPAKVNNTDRIKQHGFDIKQSFRHRK